MFTGPGRYIFRSLYLPDRCIDVPSSIAHRDEGRVQQYTLYGSVYQKWVVVEDTHMYPASGSDPGDTTH